MKIVTELLQHLEWKLNSNYALMNKRLDLKKKSKNQSQNQDIKYEI